MKSFTPTLLLPSCLLVAAGVALLSSRHPAASDGRDAPGSSQILPPVGPGSSSSNEPGNPTRKVLSPAEQEASHQAMLKKLRGILSIGDTIDRSRALLALIDRLQPGDFPAALLGLREMKLGNDSAEYRMLLEAWAGSDPAGALAFAGSDSLELQMVISRWAMANPSAAVAWLENSCPPERAAELMATALGILARSDPDAAMRKVAGLAAERQGAAVDEIAKSVAACSSDHGAHWLESIGDPALQIQAARSLSTSLYPSNAAEAARILDAYPDAASRQGAAAVYLNWSRQDATAAEGAFDHLPEGELRTGAFQGILYQLGQSDPGASLDFLQKHPEESPNDAVLKYWITNTSGQDPTFALDQIPRIQSPEAREEAYRTVLASWQFKDRDAAGQWLSANQGVPESVRIEFERR